MIKGDDEHAITRRLSSLGCAIGCVFILVSLRLSCKRPKFVRTRWKRSSPAISDSYLVKGTCHDFYNHHRGENQNVGKCRVLSIACVEPSTES